MRNIEKVLTLSSAHIPMEPARTVGLGLGERGPRVQEHEYGWIVFLGDAETDITRPQPEWLLPIVKLAHEHDCAFINFDRDGDDVDGLPTYDW
jgi:hypothetical protein